MNYENGYELEKYFETILQTFIFSFCNISLSNWIRFFLFFLQIQPFTQVNKVSHIAVAFNESQGIITNHDLSP